MKFHPTLFSTEMVIAILDNRKKQTRRIIKPQPLKQLFYVNMGYWSEEPENLKYPYLKSRYQIGDVLWVRETLYQNGELALEYDADSEEINSEIIPLDFNVKIDKHGNYKCCKIPSIYMPKWACRIFLKITNIKVERLNDISEEDAIAEGCSLYGPFDEYRGALRNNESAMKYNAFSKASRAFRNIWESINSEESWKSNPWVWVVEFERIEEPENFIV